jgi:hypothetical protein
MASRRKTEKPDAPNRKPASSPEARELQLVGMAYDLLEQRLADGTASSQEVTTLIKFGSTRESLEQMKIEHEIELARVKAEGLAKADRLESLMGDALDAFRSYQGSPPQEDILDED